MEAIDIIDLSRTTAQKIHDTIPTPHDLLTWAGFVGERRGLLFPTQRGFNEQLFSLRLYGSKAADPDCVVNP